MPQKGLPGKVIHTKAAEDEHGCKHLPPDPATKLKKCLYVVLHIKDPAPLLNSQNRAGIRINLGMMCS